MLERILVATGLRVPNEGLCGTSLGPILEPLEATILYAFFKESREPIRVASLWIQFQFRNICSQFLLHGTTANCPEDQTQWVPLVDAGLA